MPTLQFSVQGMTCGGCVRHVEKALKNTPDVTAVAVDLASGTATVEGTASADLLIRRVTEAGYAMSLKG